MLRAIQVTAPSLLWVEIFLDCPAEYYFSFSGFPPTSPFGSQSHRSKPQLQTEAQASSWCVSSEWSRNPGCWRQQGTSKSPDSSPSVSKETWGSERLSNWLLVTQWVSSKAPTWSKFSRLPSPCSFFTPRGQWLTFGALMVKAQMLL